MFVAGIDAHATYSVIAIVSNTGQLVAGPIRIKNTQQDRLDDLLQQYQPIEVVVETSPAWPHAKRLRVIAESNYKSDDIDAELPKIGRSRTTPVRASAGPGVCSPDKVGQTSARDRLPPAESKTSEESDRKQASEPESRDWRGSLRSQGKRGPSEDTWGSA